jgi:hypothetical protein
VWVAVDGNRHVKEPSWRFSCNIALMKVAVRVTKLDLTLSPLLGEVIS